MAFKLTKTNNFKTKVDVVTPTDGGDVKWSFTGEFRIVLAGEDLEGKDYIDVIFVGASGVPADDDISQDELMEMLKKRPDTRNAIVSAYNKAVVKKNQTSNLFG